METFLIKALQLILSLSILVVIHEFGHFLFARIFKIKVEKFYLFFNPWFSLFKFKPKNSDTEYGIGWLPLGGYVKISGMIDESMDKEQMAQPAQPWEFRSKPAWQRLLVMVGGVLFNFLLALFIYAMMLFAWGDTYISMKTAKDGMVFSQVAKEIGGFQDHDIILSVDRKDLNQRSGVTSINTLMHFIDADSVRISRQGVEQTLILPKDFAARVIASDEKMSPFSLWTTTKLDSVIEKSAAARSGLQKGDSIVSINNVEVTSFAHLNMQIKDDKIKNMRVPLLFVRDSILYRTSVFVDENQVIGIWASSKNYEVVTDQYGFFSSIPAGIKMGVETLKAYVAQARFIFTEKGVKNLGGFGAIGSMFPAQWNWYAFWSMTAFLSIVLAFMNILPIPALDGGHIMFLLYEVITRRKPSEKFMEYAQWVGMILLFSLLLFANGNDLIRAIFK